MSTFEFEEENTAPEVKARWVATSTGMDGRDGPTEIAKWTAEMIPEIWGWTAEMEPKRSEWTARDGHERSTIVWRLE